MKKKNSIKETKNEEINKKIKNSNNNNKELAQKQFRIKIKKKEKDKNFRNFIEKVICIGIILSFLLIISPIYQIHGNGMEPTIKNDSFVFINKIAYFKRTPKTGDIILFNHDNHEKVSRIIGIPGDTISFKDGFLLINNEICKENYISDDINTFDLINDKEYVVPYNQYFVLLDNREGILYTNEEFDSRNYIGNYIDTKSIKGKVMR